MKPLSLFALLFACSSSLFAQGGDECANAMVIAGAGPHAFDQTAATASADPSSCTLTREDVWFEWTAAETETYTFSTCGGTLHQTTLRVYDGCGGVQMACGSSWCRAQSRVEFPAIAGTTYWLRIGTAANNGGGSGTFRIFIDRPLVNPANGHAYRAMFNESDWVDAWSDSATQMFHGHGGHLVTITSQAEQDWILANLEIQEPFTGLFQNTFSSPDYSEPFGGWEWTTGEPLGFTNWGSGSPDDGSFGNEDYGAMQADGSWQDVLQATSGIHSHIVEWDPQPEGSTFCEPSDLNSAGRPTVLTAFANGGSGAGIRLQASQGPPNQFGYVLVGTAAQDPGVVLGAGHLCLALTPGNLLGRYNVGGTNRDSIGLFNSDGILQHLPGASSIDLGFDVPLELPLLGAPFIQAGQTWYFQLWHREDNGSSNLSNGVAVPF